MACQLPSISPAVKPVIAATLRRFSTSVLISIRAPLSAKRLRFQIKSRRCAPTRNMSCNPVSIQHQGYARLLSENTLQGTGTRRTSGRQAQTLQAYRTSMREDGAELRLVRRACSRLHLDQIRPHSLERTPLAHYTHRTQWEVIGNILRNPELLSVKALAPLGGKSTSQTVISGLCVQPLAVHSQPKALFFVAIKLVGATAVGPLANRTHHRGHVLGPTFCLAFESHILLELNLLRVLWLRVRHNPPDLKQPNEKRY